MASSSGVGKIWSATARTFSENVGGQGRFSAGVVAVDGAFLGQVHYCLFLGGDRSRRVWKSMTGVGRWGKLHIRSIPISSLRECAESLPQLF
jgi:hypothetical protein